MQVALADGRAVGSFLASSTNAGEKDVLKPLLGSICIVGVFVLGLVACSAPGSGSTITVFAAASLTDAFNDLAQEFERQNKNVDVLISYQGSSALRIQLAQGASADVFASADEFNMGLAIKAGVIAGKPQTFARNQLAIIVSRNSNVVSRLEDLSKPGLRLVTGDEMVPVGRYTTAALNRLAADPAFGTHFRDKFEGNIASKESNVRRAVSKVEIGEADAAIGYVTDARGAGRDDLIAISIPKRYTEEIRYPIGMVARPATKILAEAFISFVLSEDGQQILRSHEFLPAKGPL